jgi:hypothetical protein
MGRLLGKWMLVVPALLLLLVYVGDQLREPLVTAPLFFVLLAVLGIGVWRRWAPVEDAPPETERRLWARGSATWWIRAAALIAGGLLLLLLSSREYQHMVLYPVRGAFLWVAVGAAGIGLLLLLIRPPRPLYSIVVLAMAGLAIRACGMAQWEIDPVRRDMLPLVLSAIDAFLSGESPYQLHQMQVGSQVPLTYPPGLWLAHLPAHVLGLDIRWTGWLADGLILGALGVTAARLRASFGPVFLGLAVYLFLPDTHWNGIYAEPHADWAILAWLAAAALLRKPLATGALLGVALTTRPFNLVLLPFLAIWLFRAHGLRTAWRSLVVAGLIAAALYLPFVLWDPDAFYAGTVRWLLGYGEAHHTWFYGMLSFSGPLYESDLASWLAPLQGISLAVLIGLAVWKLKTTRGLLACWTLAYALFVAFNSIVWMSFWIGVCLLAIAWVAAAGSPAAEPDRVGPSRSLKWLVVELVGSAVVVGAAAVLIWLLSAHFSEDGRDRVRQQIADNAVAGDLVLDRSGYRVSFMREPWLFDRGQLAAGVKLAADPFTAVLPRRGLVEPLAHEKVWVVERFGLFAEHAPVYLGQSRAGAYEAVEDRRVGRYRLVQLERKVGASADKLSELFDRLEVSAESRGIALNVGLEGGAWRFDGRRKWERVSVTPCRIDRARRAMLWAHPLRDGMLSIRLPLEEGTGGGLVYGGLTDKAPRWGHGPVDMSVRAYSEPIADLRFPNAPGLRGASFEIPDSATELTFEISAADVGRRHFCFDAVFGE